MQQIQLLTVLALTLVIGACSKSGKDGSSGGTSESANPYQAVVQSNGAVLRVTGISDATAQKMMVLVNVLAPTGSNGNPSIERLPIDEFAVSCICEHRRGTTGELIAPVEENRDHDLAARLD